MRPLIALPLMMTMCLTLSGCIAAAAALPVLAAGAIGKQQLDGDKDEDAEKKPAETGTDSTQYSVPYVNVRGGADEVATGKADIIAASDRASASDLPYGAFIAYAEEQIVARASGADIETAVLVPRVDIDSPESIACGEKPAAVLIDLDDAEGSMDEDALSYAAQEGLADGLAGLRARGIDIIWLSDAPQETAPDMRSLMALTGLYRLGSGDEFLFDRGGDDRKQLRRQEAAENHCILAAAGDAYADFDELYDYLLYPEVAAPLDPKYDNGWFLTPPPIMATNMPVSGK